jgi:hypothetical protein
VVHFFVDNEAYSLVTAAVVLFRVEDLFHRRTNSKFLLGGVQNISHSLPVSNTIKCVISHFVHYVTFVSKPVGLSLNSGQ